MATEKRNRARLGFWLDFGKDDELMVAETIDNLKRNRKYQRAIIQGLKLIVSLWDGRVDILLEMFPWVADAICQHVPPNNNEDVLKQLAELRIEIREQKQQQSRQPRRDDPIPAPPAGYPAMKQSGAGIGTLSTHTFSLPIIDDDSDGDTIVLNKSTGSAGKDALASLLKIAF